VEMWHANKKPRVVEISKVSCSNQLFHCCCTVCNSGCSCGWSDYQPRHAGISTVWWHVSIY